MERAMKSVAAGLNLPPRAPTPPGLSSRRSESDIASVTSSQMGPEFGAALKPSKSNTETVSALKLAQDTACLFHRRFQDCIDIEKVIEEIAADHTMSHSKLLQTALGVREVSKQLQRRPIKRAARTIMIVTKARDNDLVYKTRELAEWLMRTPRYGSPMGVTVYVDSKLRNSKRFDADGLLASDPRFELMLKYWTPDTCWTHPEKFDLVLTLGGDGTVLFTSWLFQRIVPPILSFSLGSLGFLTPFDFAHYREHLDRTMGGHSSLTPLSSGISTPATPPSEIASDAGMRVNMRMRFTCTVYRAPPRSNRSAQPEEVSKFEVLNELVIDRGPSPYVSNLELFGDDEPLTVIQADGVIFSTPTGSTAYSLSAGGSLVHPDIPAILLTPICPHTLSFRPMLLNDTMALRIAVPRHSRATAYCSFDGKGRIELRQGDFVTIAASKYPFPTVMGGKMEWIDSVSRTLRWNTRQAQQKGWNGSKSSKPHGSSASLATKPTRGLSNSSTSSGIPSRTNSTSLFGGSATQGSSITLSRFRSDSDAAYDERDEDEFEYGDDEDLTDGEEVIGVAEEFDIDIDEDDDSPLDSKDSGYEGDAASNASWGGHGTGTASPARRGLSLLNMG